MEHLRITVAGNTYDVVVERTDSAPTEAPSPVSPVRASAPASSPPPAAPAPAAPAAAAGDTVSPLAGVVQAVEVQPGATVNEGDLILTLEAMKMYTPINASASGTIKAVHVKPGDAVEEGQPLYSIA